MLIAAPVHQLQQNGDNKSAAQANNGNHYNNNNTNANNSGTANHYNRNNNTSANAGNSEITYHYNPNNTISANAGNSGITYHYNPNNNGKNTNNSAPFYTKKGIPTNSETQLQSGFSLAYNALNMGYNLPKKTKRNRLKPIAVTTEEGNAKAILPLTLATILADSIPQKDENIVGKASLRKKRKPAHLEIGLAGEIGTQVLWNSETRASLRTTSTSKTEFRPATSVSLNAQWNFDARNALQVSFAPKAQLRQLYFVYLNGQYSSRLIEMNYLKFALSYQRHFARSEYGCGLVRVGAYMGHLQQRQEQYVNAKQQWSLDNTKLFRRWDCGLRAAFGLSLYLSQLGFGSGLAGGNGLA